LTITFRSVGYRYRSGRGFVLWKEVDEGWIRFDSFSGATHLLSPLARFIIEAIDESLVSLSFRTIVECVLGAEKEAHPVDCQVEVESVLQILLEAQLIEPAQR
jgi:hypothetical protein